MARQHPYLKRGTWSGDEDEKLVAYIMKYGIWNWNQMPRFAGLQRSGKSCRLRWMNYLKPDIRRGNFTREEEETIIQLQKMLGNRWSAIAARLPQRTDNDIKNYWNTRLKKRVQLENNNSASSIPETNSCIIEPEPEISCGADSFTSSTENSSASASVSPTQIVSAIGSEPEQENSSDVVDSTIFVNDFPGLEPAACTTFSPPDSSSNWTVGVNGNYTTQCNLVSSENLNYWETESLWEQPLMMMEGLVDCEAFAPNSQLWHNHHEHYNPVNDFWVNPLI